MEDAGVRYLLLANLALGTAVAACFVAVLYQALRDACPGVLKRVFRFVSSPTFHPRSRFR
jgi:hypothetical protein